MPTLCIISKFCSQYHEAPILYKRAHKLGFQLRIHACGDITAEVALNAIEHALKAKPRRDHRHRIEHLNLLSDELINRIRELDVIVGATIGIGGPYPEAWDVAKRLYGSDRAERMLFRHAEMLRSGMMVIEGTDCHPSPYFSVPDILHRFVNYGAKITPEEAITIFTKNAAYASFEEDIKGSIRAGKLADFTILSDDPREIAKDSIKDITVDVTIMNGRLIHKSM